MEAPEKIYLQENTTTDCYDKFWPEWFEARAKDTDIEYTRTDAFIEKACEFIKERFSFEDSWHVEGETTILDKIIEDFKNYMKGGEE